MVKDKEYLQEAADSIYNANADEIVRQQCRAREEAERRERTLERDIKKLQDYSEELQGDIANLKENVADLEENVADLEEKNLQQELLIKELQAKLAGLEYVE